MIFLLSMSFRKDPYRVSRKQAMFGKNIIITGNTDCRALRPFAVIKSETPVEDLLYS